MRKVNTLCKYPSIPTYHALDPATGKLTEAVAVEFGDEPVVVTEKVDGTNARVVLFPDGSWLIGSREELLTARGDLIPNPAQGIVAALNDAVVDLAAGWPTTYGGENLAVLFLEVYGGKTSAASANYTGEGKVGVALFDFAFYPNWRGLLALPIEEIARWRDDIDFGAQWWPEDWLRAESWHPFDLVPELSTARGMLRVVTAEGVGAHMPETLAGARGWLGLLLPDRQTRCALDEKARGVAEGVVVRTADRGKIAKLKFRDYDRALGGKR